MIKIFYVCAICCRPEVGNNVISGMAIENVGVEVPVKFGVSRSNGFRDIRGGNFVSNERTNEHKMANHNSASPKNNFVTVAA